MTREAMLAGFDDKELLTFQGRGGQTMTYIEDETVMDRLDLGYGPGGWSIEVEPFPYVEGVVKVTLAVKAGNEWVRYSDFGYPNRDGGESLKEAVSDGIRRCGRFVGIAREIYKKHSTPVTRARATGPSSPVAPSRPANVTPIRHDEDLLDPDEEDIDQLHMSTGPSLTHCECGQPWKGEPGDLWHKTAEGAYHRHPDNVKKPRAASR